MTRFQCTLAALALIALCGSSTWAKEPVPKTRVTMADAKSIAKRSIRLEMSGQPIGGMSMLRGRMADGGTLLQMEMLIKVRRGRGPDADLFVKKSYSLEYYDPAHRMRWTQKREEEAGVITTTDAEYGETHVEFVLEGPGSRVEKRLELAKEHNTDFRVFMEQLKRFKRGETARGVYKTLDVESRTYSDCTLTITGKTTIEHAGEKHEGYVIEQVSPSLKATMVVDEGYLPMHVKLMGVIEGVWVDESPFEFSSDGWELSSYVPVEGVAPMAPHLESLEMTVTFAGELPDDKPAFQENRYQKVRRNGKAYHLTLASTRPPPDSPAISLPMTVEDKEVTRFLTPTPLSQSDHPDIIARARKIAGKATDARIVTTRIVNWVSRTLEKRSAVRGNATALETLKSGVGDCSEHAALTVALCRAVGLPARNMSGLTYLVGRDGRPLAGYHAWAEVWLGQWVGVDATIPEVGTSARYVMFEIDEPGMEPGTGTILRAVMAKPQLRIDAYRSAGGERVVLER